MSGNNPSTLSADRPVDDPAKDRLGLAPFAQHLAETICKMVPAEGLVLAVHGPWGSGKTTLLRFVSHFLNQKPDRERPIVVHFNPWWFSGHEDLTRRFFGQLQAVLSKSKAEVEEVRKRLAEFAELVSELPVPYAQGGKSVARVLRPVQKDVPKLKTALEAALRKYGRKILVIVDDIDRLSAEEIRQLFRLIKAVGDLPNVVYLVAFDRQVVVRALDDIQSGSGEAYLEKIVQVPFELPLPDRTLLRRLLLEKLGLILGDTSGTPFDETYWGNVYFEGIDHFIGSARDVVRLTNALSVTFPAVRGEVNPVDFVGIETLRLFCSPVYEVIRQNMAAFAGPSDLGSLSSLAGDQTKEFHDLWLGHVPDDDRAAVRQLAVRLFPKLESVWGNTHYREMYLPIWRRELRICSPDIFPIYFRLAVPEGSITQKEIDAILALGTDAKALGANLVELAGRRRPNGATRARALLERLEDYTERAVPDVQIPSMVAAMLDVGDQLLEQEEDESRGPFDFGSQWNIARVNWRLLRRLDESARFQILSEAITAGGSVSIIVHEVVLLGREHGKYDAQRQVPESERMVSSDHLTTLEQLALQKVRSKAHDGSLILTSGLPTVLHFWHDHAGTEEIRTWVGDVTSSDKGLACFLERFLGIGFSQVITSSIGRRFYRLDPKSLQPYLEPSQIVSRVSTLAENVALTDRQRMAAKQFLKEYRLRAEGKDPDMPSSWNGED